MDCFKALVGHSQTVHSLREMLSSKRLPHALLFSGPEAVGKRSAALCLAQGILLEQAPEQTLEKQQYLLSIGSHPDVHFAKREVEKKDLSVESIRSLCANLRLKPYYDRATVCLIDNAHEMSIAAANALLLTLEEPPANTYFILSTHVPHRLPPTIISRCQSVFFGELSPLEVNTLLSRIIPSELAAENFSELCPGSIQGLRLGELVKERSMGLEQSAELKAHLSFLLKTLEQLAQVLNSALNSAEAGSLSATMALNLACELAADNLEIGLDYLLNQIRKRLRKLAENSSRENLLNTEEICRWSKFLLEALQAEKLLRERNLNPQLKLSATFLEMT